MSDIKKYEPLWGAWLIDSLIGEGLYGKVYKLRQEESGQSSYAAVKILSIPYDEAAIKQMRAAGLSESSMLEFAQVLVTNIRREVDLINDVKDNKHIVRYTNVEFAKKTDEIGWDIMLGMDYLKSLPNHNQREPMSEEEVIKFGKHIGQALALCAQNNIIHLNIKPENIFVSSSGDYMLGDIGIAQPMELAQTGLVKMDSDTCIYMAPEVYKGEQYNVSADIYSLGMLMYCLLNKNRSPFLPTKPQGITPSDRDNALQKRISGEPIPDLKGISPALNTLVLKACAYEIGDRFASPAAMLEELEALTKQDVMMGQEVINKQEAINEQGVITDKEAVSEQTIVSSNVYNDVIDSTAIYTALVASDDMTGDASEQKNVIFSEKLTKKKRGKPLRVAAGLIVVAIIICGYILNINGFSSFNKLVQQLDPSPAESVTVADGKANEDQIKKEDAPSIQEQSTNEDKVADESDSTLPESTSTTNGETKTQTSQKPQTSQTTQKPVTQTAASTPQSVRINLSGKSITNAKLASMIKSGEIPKNVTELDLSNNQISDLSPLSSLTGLTSLNLSNNQIDATITSLQYLTKLQCLYLNNNRISSFDGIKTLKSLVNLRVLHIQSNNVRLSSSQEDFLMENFPDNCAITYST